METSLMPRPEVPLVIANANRLSVRQRKRWMEILFSWESKNTYVVYNEAGEPVLNVQEQGKGIGKLLKRLFLRSLRPFTVHVEDLTAQDLEKGHVMTLTRPFRFFFHRLEITGSDGKVYGAIQRRWAWLRRKYDIEGPNGEHIASLFGPILRPWTFEVRMPGSDECVALVQKKWSGLAKEMFSEADNFWVEMDNISDPQLRAILFAATVLIDIVHFEQS
ncbi:MAG: hypothetical protein JKY56_18150 [Kofleriaceae bacterium]|nr:hypothetical protein [Kofleriaceae bacterium]